MSVFSVSITLVAIMVLVAVIAFHMYQDHRNQKNNTDKIQQMIYEINAVHQDRFKMDQQQQGRLQTLDHVVNQEIPAAYVSKAQLAQQVVTAQLTTPSARAGMVDAPRVFEMLV